MGKLARTEIVGSGVTIHPTAEFIDVEHLEIGDHSYVGPNVRIVGGYFSVGEYSKIHNGVYVYPKKRVKLGHCTWIGQGTHLDGTGGIEAGDFLGVGINSALYSHIRHGDITEGCQLDNDGSLEIADDVWFVGMCLVSPVRVESKSVAMLGSVVTRDMMANRVYGGNPARDITDKMGSPWSERTLDEKVSRVNDLVEMFFREVRPDLDRESVIVTDGGVQASDGRTEYNVADRTYTKTNSATEVELNKWMFGYRAKFRPLGGSHD